MALVFLKQNDIVRRFLELKNGVADDDLTAVHDYFERTWVNGFGTALICQHDELFRTNNNSEAFHSSLRRLFFAAHPHFNEFVGKVTDLMDSVRTDFEAEQLNPKQLDRRLARAFVNIQSVVDNFYNDRALGLPLPDLLQRIGEILHDDACFEESYEEGAEATFEPVGEELYGEGVAMELDDEGGDE